MNNLDYFQGSTSDSTRRPTLRLPAVIKSRTTDHGLSSYLGLVRFGQPRLEMWLDPGGSPWPGNDPDPPKTEPSFNPCLGSTPVQTTHFLPPSTGNWPTSLVSWTETSSDPLLAPQGICPS
jgi:hypothetical protein